MIFSTRAYSYSDWTQVYPVKEYNVFGDPDRLSTATVERISDNHLLTSGLSVDNVGLETSQGATLVGANTYGAAGGATWSTVQQALIWLSKNGGGSDATTTYTLAYPQLAIIWQNGTQTLTNNSETTVSFTDALKNPNGMWSAAHPKYITIPVTGYYICFYSISYGAISGTLSSLNYVGRSQIVINGAAGNTNRTVGRASYVLGSVVTSYASGGLVYLNAGDIVALTAFQNWTGNVTLGGPGLATRTNLGVVRVSEELVSFLVTGGGGRTAVVAGPGITVVKDGTTTYTVSLSTDALTSLSLIGSMVQNVVAGENMNRSDDGARPKTITLNSEGGGGGSTGVLTVLGENGVTVANGTSTTVTVGLTTDVQTSIPLVGGVVGDVAAGPGLVFTENGGRPRTETGTLSSDVWTSLGLIGEFPVQVYGGDGILVTNNGGRPISYTISFSGQTTAVLTVSGGPLVAITNGSGPDVTVGILDDAVTSVNLVGSLARGVKAGNGISVTKSDERPSTYTVALTTAVQNAITTAGLGLVKNVVSANSNATITSDGKNPKTLTLTVTTSGGGGGGITTSTLAVSAYHSTTQAITAGADTRVLFNGENFDTSNMHSTSVNTGLFTVPAGGHGYWIVMSSITFASGAASKNARCHFSVNGQIATTNQWWGGVSGSLNAAETAQRSGAAIMLLNAGDTVEVDARINTGAMILGSTTVGLRNRFQMALFGTGAGGGTVSQVKAGSAYVTSANDTGPTVTIDLAASTKTILDNAFTTITVTAPLVTTSTSGPITNLSIPSAITTSTVYSQYARLDGSNQPFTGDIGLPHIGTNWMLFTDSSGVVRGDPGVKVDTGNNGIVAANGTFSNDLASSGPVRAGEIITNLWRNDEGTTVAVAFEPDTGGVQFYKVKIDPPVHPYGGELLSIHTDGGIGLELIGGDDQSLEEMWIDNIGTCLVLTRGHSMSGSPGGPTIEIAEQSGGIPAIVVDGTPEGAICTGLNADLLDDHHASYFATVTALNTKVSTTTLASYSYVSKNATLLAHTLALVATSTNLTSNAGLWWSQVNGFTLGVAGDIRATSGTVYAAFNGNGANVTSLNPANLSAAVPMSKGGTGTTSPTNKTIPRVGPSNFITDGLLWWTTKSTVSGGITVGLKGDSHTSGTQTATQFVGGGAGLTSVTDAGAMRLMGGNSVSNGTQTYLDANINGTPAPYLTLAQFTGNGDSSVGGTASLAGTLTVVGSAAYQLPDAGGVGVSATGGAGMDVGEGTADGTVGGSAVVAVGGAGGAGSGDYPAGNGAIAGVFVGGAAGDDSIGGFGGVLPGAGITADGGVDTNGYGNAPAAILGATRGNTLIGAATDDGVNKLQVVGQIAPQGSGSGVLLKNGSNQQTGSATLTTGGTVTVSNTYVKTGAVILLSRQSFAGTPTTPGDLKVDTIVNSTSFVITSTLTTDRGVIGYVIFNPAP